MDLCTNCSELTKKEICIAVDNLPVFSDEEVYGVSRKGGFVEPVPDPFGQPYGRPRVPKAKAKPKAQVVLQQSSLERAPEQEEMADGDEEAPDSMEESPAEEEQAPSANEVVEVCKEPESNARIAESEMFERAWWCIYCCCVGIGSGDVVQPRPVWKCACWRAEMESDVFTHDRDGMFNCIVSLCCCHTLCQTPRREKTPDFMCCNEIMGDPTKVSKAKKAENLEFPQIQPFDAILSQAFTACYYRLFGCSLSPTLVPMQNSCCTGSCKFGCCSSNYQCTVPNSFVACYDDEYGWCTYMATCLWLHVHCRVPPHLVEAGKLNCPLVAFWGRSVWGEEEDKESPWVKPVQPATN
jgi:hypothetical protein